MLHGLLEAIAGTQCAATDVYTDAEVLAAYYGLAQEYRDDSAWICNDSTLAFIRAMRTANPRDYGEIGFQYLSMGELGETLMGRKIYTNSNWDAVVGGVDDAIGLTHIDINEAVAWVERRGISIFVDPYSERAATGTINFLPSARFNGVVVNSAAIYSIENNTV